MTTSPYDNLPTGNTKKIINANAETNSAPEAWAKDGRTTAITEAEAGVGAEAEVKVTSKAGVDPAEAKAAEARSAEVEPEAETAEAKPKTEAEPETFGYVEVDLEEPDTIPDTEQQNESQQKPDPPQNELQYTAESETQVSKEHTNISKKQTPASPAIPHARQERHDFAKAIPLDKAPQYSKLNLKNRCGVKEYILPFEESLLVPDTLPDISEVLFAEAKVKLTASDKAVYDKNDFLSGDIILYTVYRPDSHAKSPVDVIKSAIPFKTDKCWSNAAGSSFRAEVTIKTAHAEMTNERKFIAKGELLIRFTEISPIELSVFKGAGDPAFMQHEDTLTATNLCFEAEESSEISQTIKLGDGQLAPVRILKDTIKIVENHRQITSGKLVINATISCSILYLGESLDGGDRESKLGCVINKTDFTQFILLKENLDTSFIKTCFIDDDLKINIENQDEFILQGHVRTLIQGYENKNIVMVSDTYHKERDVRFDISEQPLFHVKNTVSGEITAREVINIKDSQKKPAALICGYGQPDTVSARPEHGRMIIEGNMSVKLLALDDEGTPFVITSDFPLRGSLEMPAADEEFVADVSYAVREFWFDEINSRQVEVNVSVAIDVWLNNIEAFKTIENLCFAEEKEPAKRIAMAVYTVAGGDTLWDIAKRYKSDTAALAELNEIDESQHLPEGMKIFVMK